MQPRGLLAPGEMLVVVAMAEEEVVVQAVVVAVSQLVALVAPVAMDLLLLLILAPVGPAVRLMHHFQALRPVVLEEIYQGHHLHLVVDLVGMPTNLYSMHALVVVVVVVVDVLPLGMLVVPEALLIQVM
jgi:hypothetical protein